QHALADCTLPSASALVHVAIYAQWTFTTKLSPMSGVPEKEILRIPASPVQEYLLIGLIV
ncbi:MAG: hypothetical protein LKF62_05515, partial [Solobacterium sp.]|nr:hypothetical protein [Solobacterium sp.]